VLLTTRNTPILHLSYHAKFGRSRSNHLGVNRENPKKNSGSWPSPLEWWHMSDSLKTCPSPTTIMTANLVVVVKTIGAELRRSSERSFTLPILPFKVTHGHWNRQIGRPPMTSYLMPQFVALTIFCCACISMLTCDKNYTCVTKLMNSIRKKNN